LDATGYSVIVPVAPAIADATGAGPATIGLLVAAFPAGMVAGFGLAGWLVRRHGARPLLAASLAVVALGALGFVLGDSLAVYFPARLLMGIGSGGIWIGVTFDTLERWPGQEYVCMSRVFAAYSAGGLIGPALGAFGGVQGPFLAYLLLLLAALPLVVLVSPPASRRGFAADRSVLRTRPFVRPRLRSCSPRLRSAYSRASSRCTWRRAWARPRSERSTWGRRCSWLRARRRPAARRRGYSCSPR
jgi:MFS family permease